MSQHQTRPPTQTPSPTAPVIPAHSQASWICQMGSVGGPTSNSSTSTTLDASAANSPDGNNSADVVPSGDLVSELRGLTVGQSFQLVCKGEATPFQTALLRIETRGAEPKSGHFYQLQLLKVNQSSDSQLDAVVTSFETGDHAPKDLILTDGSHAVELTGFQFTVQSVLQKELETPPQPFGPLGPFKLSWSWTLVAPVLIFLLVLILLLMRFLRNRVQQRTWTEEVKGFKTARRPLDELLGDVRALDRKFDFNQDQLPALGKDLRYLFDVFLVRTFSIAAHRMAPAQTLNILRKHNHKKDQGRVAEPTLSLVQKTMVELRSLEKRTEFIPSTDIQQVVQLIRKSADLVVADHDRRGPK